MIFLVLAVVSSIFNHLLFKVSSTLPTAPFAVFGAYATLIKFVQGRFLSVPDRQSSELFPTISIAVVGLSALGAWAFFHERLHRRMLGALVIGVGSIVLVNP